MKSFQREVKAKVPSAASAGLESGMMMRQKIVDSDAPSMRPASSISRGRVWKNCRSMKMLNAPAAPGTMSPRKLFSQPCPPSPSRLFPPNSGMCRRTTNEGIIVTCAGIIIVASSVRKIAWRPGKRSRANAYAAIDEITSMIAVPPTATTTVLKMYRPNGAACIART